MWRMLWWALGLAFISATVCISISPLAHWTQELGSCRGAEEIERDVRDGGPATTRGPGGGNSTTTISTTVFTLSCTYEDGETKLVENDAAVLRGIGVSILLGAIPGALIGLALSIRARLRERRAAESGPTLTAP